MPEAVDGRRGPGGDSEVSSPGGADDGSAGSRMLREVREGLTGTPRELSPKYFYDRRGSELFEEITRLPEYYLTGAEIEILRGPIRRWIRELAPSTLVELGAGSGRKTRILLEAMRDAGDGAVYVPVDVSGDFLEGAARRLRGSYPELRVEPVVADMTGSLEGLEGLERPAVFALLGSTIGNFRPPEARELLSRVRERMDPGDRFLMGADLRPGGSKPLEVVEAAYDDRAGVTAEFNRNVLRVLNRELGTDFDVDAFRHRAFYDRDQDRIEMHLVAERDVRARLPDGTGIEVREGESIRTEISCKYDRETVEGMFSAAGLEVAAWVEDDDGRYAMAVGTRAGASV